MWMALMVSSPFKGARTGAAWVGVWLGVGASVGAGSVGSMVAGSVSDDCIFSVAWAVGPSAAGGVTSRQPNMAKTNVRESHKNAIIFLFIAYRQDLVFFLEISMIPIPGKFAKLGFTGAKRP